jgi:hypothetical protein
MSNGVLSRFGSLLSQLLFTYPTAKQVEVQNTSIGTIYRILQVAVIVYIVV